MSAEGLEQRLGKLLDERYHHRHPFNLRMHRGELRADELRTWVRNRYYYQTRIPRKDNLILDKSDEAKFRRRWQRRVRDHEGEPGQPGQPARPGGLALWLDLAGAVGLDRGEVASLRDVLPGVRRACDAYVQFVASHDLLESVAASLTELRAGALMGERIAAFEKHYPFVDREGLAYFVARTRQAPRDAEEALAHVLAEARSAEDEARCLAALERKCEILWSLLDGVEWGGSRLRLAPHALLRDAPEAMVVLPERAVELNEAGRAVLACCDGQRSVCEVAALLRSQQPEAEPVERDAYAFLEEMQRLGVLQAAP